MPTISPCPYLPSISTLLPITHTRLHREECGPAFYLACLELAQSLWMQQLPAQAILQINKSMMAQLPANHPVLEKHPIAYSALQWIIQNAASEKFIGNPPRHFQHLASRMNYKLPQPELRVARAWCCLHLAETILDEKNFPRDQRQVEKENLVIPTKQEALASLSKLSPHHSEVISVSEILG